MNDTSGLHPPCTEEKLRQHLGELKEQLHYMFTEDKRYSFSKARSHLDYISAQWFHVITMDVLTSEFNVEWNKYWWDTIDTNTDGKQMAGFLKLVERCIHIAAAFHTLSSEYCMLSLYVPHRFSQIVNLLVFKTTSDIISGFFGCWNRLIDKSSDSITPEELDTIKKTYRIFIGHSYPEGHFDELDANELKCYKIKNFSFNSLEYSKYEPVKPCFVAMLLDYKHPSGIAYGALVPRYLFDNTGRGPLHALIRHQWDIVLQFGYWNKLSSYCQKLICDVQYGFGQRGEPNYVEIDKYLLTTAAIPDKFVLKKMQFKLVEWIQRYLTAENYRESYSYTIPNEKDPSKPIPKTVHSDSNTVYFAVGSRIILFVVKLPFPPCSDDHMEMVTMFTFQRQ